MKGAPNPKTQSAQKCHALMGLQIRRLILANRDIHEGRSKSGGSIRPKVSCTDGAPNSKTYLGQS
ncbi:hypothetical protein ACSBR1_008290 [Camellia fascicularis]